MTRIPTLFLTCAALACTLEAQVLAPTPLFVPAATVEPAALARDLTQRGLRPQIVSSDFVRIDRAALIPFSNGLAVRPAFDLELGGRPCTLVLDSLERIWKDQTLYRGHVDGSGHFLMVVAADGTAAAAIEVGDEVWSLEHAGVPGDLHVLYTLDHDRMSQHMGCGVDHSHEVAAPGGPAGGVDDGTTPIIDVAVFYTTAARQGAGSVAAIETQAALRVAYASDSSQASGVNHLMRLVYTAETAYTETGTSTDLSRFRNRTDGYMDEVHAARTTYGADLMALLINQSSAFCGVGYLMTTASTGFRTSAFSVTVVSCLTGHTLTHEMGHTMGCAHDRANAGAALYSYSYGYRTPDSAYRTIMSYAPGSRVPVWSSPNVTHAGQAMGTATEDNARSLNDITATVAAFTPMTTYRWCEHGGGIAVLGVKPLLTGSGTTNGASPVRVVVSSVWPGRNGALVIGAGGQNLPLFGGTLVPFIFDAIPIVSGSPSATFDASLVRNLPSGAEPFFQGWFIEPLAAAGISASDAISVIVP